MRKQIILYQDGNNSDNKKKHIKNIILIWFDETTYIYKLINYIEKI